MIENDGDWRDRTVGDSAALATTEAREVALDCVTAGIEAAAPERVIDAAVAVEDGVLRIADARYDLGTSDEVLVLGGGKPAGRVAAALDRVLPDEPPVSGLVTSDETDAEDGRIEVRTAGHPLPDERGRDATEEILARARAADADTLVLAVVGGGGSALLPAPADGLSLEDLAAVTAALLDAGVPIDDVNAVRKHCSASKGGGLARAAAPATVGALVFSDVVGDDLGTIASGPTAGDPTTYADAAAVLERAGVDAPDAIAAHLAAGAAGERPETPAPDEPVVERVAHHVLASGRTAVEAAAETARGWGYDPLVLSTRIRGEARHVGTTLAATAEEVVASGQPVEPPAVVLSAGEATVTVTGDGVGGPNCEVATSAALECVADALAANGGEPTDGSRWALATVDTDGRDGGTDAAGALVDGETVADPAAARDALARNDTVTYLDGRAALVRTGRTGTNVNDLRALVVR